MSNKNAICQMFIEKAELKWRQILSHYNAISVEKLKAVNECSLCNSCSRCCVTFFSFDFLFLIFLCDTI